MCDGMLTIRRLSLGDTVKISDIAPGIFWEATKSVAQFTEHAAYAGTGGFERTSVVGIRTSQARRRWSNLYVVLELVLNMVHREKVQQGRLLRCKMANSKECDL